jgi:hypothetical protein
VLFLPHSLGLMPLQNQGDNQRATEATVSSPRQQVQPPHAVPNSCMSCHFLRSTCAPEQYPTRGVHPAGAGLRVLVALTKIDEYDPALVETLQHVSLSEPISSLTSKLSQASGIPPHNIFPIKNFSTEISPADNPAVAPLLYLLLHNALVCSSSFLQEEAGLQLPGGASAADVGDGVMADAQWRAHAVVAADPFAGVAL